MYVNTHSHVRLTPHGSNLQACMIQRPKDGTLNTSPFDDLFHTFFPFCTVTSTLPRYLGVVHLSHANNVEVNQGCSVLPHYFAGSLAALCLCLCELPDVQSYVRIEAVCFAICGKQSAARLARRSAALLQPHTSCTPIRP